LKSVAFEPRIAVLPVSAILPLRKVSEHTKLSAKYKLIAHSIAEVGIIEPIVVARCKDQKHRYLLLDGHLRLSAISDQSAQKPLVSGVKCLPVASRKNLSEKCLLTLCLQCV
jgi:hypothetical protein